MLSLYLRNLRRLAADRRAVTAIEYALIAALIAATIVAGVSHIGNSVSTTFNSVSSEL